MSLRNVDEWIREIDERRASTSRAARTFFLVPAPREPSADEREAAAREAEELVRARDRERNRRNQQVRRERLARRRSLAE